MGKNFYLLMKRHWPLISFVVPTLVIGYGIVIPASCIAGLNELTIGFAATIVGACVTYWLALRTSGGRHA